MKTFSIKESVNHGWEIFKTNKKILIITSLIFLALGSINMGDSNHGGSGFSDQWSNLSVVWGVLGILLFALNLIIQMGWINVLLKLED
ncbi:MAG: hypothetical protein M3Q24_01680, partial [bacterium]|nr:hypothetical protein [bacterium]